MSTSSTRPETRQRRRSPASWSPLVIVLLVVALGSIAVSLGHWSAAALWGIALLAALLAAGAFAVPALRRAPRLHAHPGSPQAVSVGRAIARPERDATGLSPELVLVLSGHPRTGKSTIAKQLVAAHPGWARASCGDFVRAQAREHGLKAPSAQTDALGQQLVDQLGGHGFLDAVLDHAHLPPDTKTLVIDDIYHRDVFEALEQRWRHLKFASITLPPTIQHSLLADSSPATEVEGPLDRAVEALEQYRHPDRRVPGAARPEDTGPALAELGGLVATA